VAATLPSLHAMAYRTALMGPMKSGTIVLRNVVFPIFLLKVQLIGLSEVCSSSDLTIKQKNLPAEKDGIKTYLHSNSLIMFYFRSCGQSTFASGRLEEKTCHTRIRHIYISSNGLISFNNYF
jgi:hypothetical protein